MNIVRDTRFKFSFSWKSRKSFKSLRIKFVINLYQFADFPDDTLALSRLSSDRLSDRIVSGNESTALDYRRVLRDRRIVYPRDCAKFKLILPRCAMHEGGIVFLNINLAPRRASSTAELCCRAIQQRPG